MIEASVPGPWAVDNGRKDNSWGIINKETNHTKKIGPVTQPRSHSKVNYFDRSLEEADNRNRALLATAKAG